MPTPEQTVFITPDPATAVQVALEPANNALHSLMLLLNAEKYSGLGSWVTETLDAMSDVEQQTHTLVMIGLYFAIMPDESWPSFPAYLDYLAEMNPVALRDRLVNNYLQLQPCEEADDHGLPIVTPQEMLQSADNYLRFLYQRFGTDPVDEEVELQAYTYVINPTALQTLIVSHLRTMWQKYLQPEWQRVLPMLNDAVRAFSHENLSQMDNLAAAEFVTGQTFSEGQLRKALGRAERVVFVPSAHVGPYIGKFKHGKTLGILFGARLPAGTLVDAPDLSRAEIAVRLTALADDTRLLILRTIAERGELRSSDIMHALDLSQSATSRHLKQLSANGYLSERRCEGAKCYSLNPERIRDTLDAIALFLTSP